MIIKTDAGRIGDGEYEEFDLHIMALGYETRCISLLANGDVQYKQLLVLKFRENEMFNFAINDKFIRDCKNVTIIDYDGGVLVANIKRYLSEYSPETVSVDISSMNRTMIAAVFSCLAQAKAGRTLRVFYAPREFKSPVMELSDIIAAGPVLPEFGGFDEESDLSSAVIMGLGFEYGVALGLLSLIEPRVAICLCATGYDQKFETAVFSANSLLEFNGVDSVEVRYDLRDVGSAFNFVDLAIENLLGQHRVSLISLGPKLFGCVLVLAAIKHLGRVSLWRIERNAPLVDVLPDGNKLSFDVDWPTLTIKKNVYDVLFADESDRFLVV